MSRIVPLAVGGILIVATTLVEGFITQRWSPGATKELAAMVEGYRAIPTQIGDWVGVDKPGQEAQMKQASAHEFIARSYRNVKTGAQIEVLMLCGFSRHVAVHTPDRCWIGQGFDKEAEPQKLSLPLDDSTAPTFFYTRFRKVSKGLLFRQRVYWAWNGGDGWQAPTYPRLKYPSWSALNKVYFITNLGSDPKADPPAKNSVAEFASLFMPKLNEAFKPPAS